MAEKLTRLVTYLCVGVAISIVLLGLAGCRMAPFDMAASIKAIEGDNGDSTPAGPFLLTFNGNTHDGGDPPASMSYMAGESISIPGENTLFKSLHTFVGWNTASDGGGTPYPVGIATMPAADVLLHAQWSAAPTYIVTYNANLADAGIPPDDANNYLDGASVTVLDNTGGLMRAGYAFDGWNTQADGLGTDYAPTSLLTIAGANETLYAQWSAAPTYTITYYANGGIGAVPTDAGSYYDGQAITIAGQGALTNGTDSFAGWNTDAGGGGTAYAPGPNTMPAGNLDLHAQWSAVSTYTVTFDSNGGSAVAPEIVPDGGLATEPVPPVLAGHTFDGWYTDLGFTTLWDFAMDTVTADVTLYAQWTADGYEIIYNANGGTGTMANQAVTFGVPDTLNANTFTRAGHRFMGWSDTSGGVVIWADADSYVHDIEVNRTQYAVWEPEYTVTYTNLDADGGIAPGDANVYIAGDTVTVLGNTGTLVRTGYTFSGWTTGTDDYVAGNTFFMPSNNVTLDPIWVPNTYNVFFDADGGTGTMAPVAVDFEQWIVLPVSTFTRTGHTFSGWSDAPSGPVIYADAANYQHVTVGDETLYAQWTPAITVGDGTSMNPYEISTPEGLDAIRADLAAHYVLTANIDLGVAPWNSGAGWEPISGFSGTLEGNFNTIHNLFIVRASGAGLFDTTQGATIRDLALENVNISASLGWAGAVAGRTDSIGGGTTITNVYATGTITGGEQLGGLVGLGQALTLDQSFADVAVSSTADNIVGGLVGRLSSGSISNSYALGSVDGVNSVGGLVGVLAGTATNTYAAGPVTGSLDVGGLVGLHSGTVNDSYYDEQTTGQVTAPGLGYTTAQMMIGSNFPAWDFLGIWDIVDGASYPFLRWQPAGTGARP